MARGLTALEVTWEAVYKNGSLLRERDGYRYKDIDRHELGSFQLVASEQLLVVAHMNNGRTGHDLCYRRRTRMSYGDKVVWYLIGFVPMGPVLAYQPETEILEQHHKFEDGGSGLFAPPVPHPEEGELFLLGVVR
jgi:hypothetical protein